MEYKMNVELTYKEVWQTLNALDLSKYHDKKGNFTYLSWTDAWQILQEQYSFATYEFMPETYEENGTVMSHCIVRIGNLERYMWLPCMDNRNNSLTNPTTRQISDTRMRCMVKCLAMFGLANYIFRGEDLPDAAKDEAEAKVVEESKPEPDQATSKPEQPETINEERCKKTPPTKMSHLQRMQQTPKPTQA